MRAKTFDELFLELLEDEPENTEFSLHQAMTWIRYAYAHGYMYGLQDPEPDPAKVDPKK